MKYWRREEYLGFARRPHSFYQGRRYAHPRDMEEYVRTGGNNAVLTDDCPDSAEEELMLRLRLTEGADIGALAPNEKTIRRILSAARPLEKAGFLRVEKERIRLTPAGFLVSNAVILRLIARWKMRRDNDGTASPLQERCFWRLFF